MEDLTKRDVKIAYHKNLQGYLWENGYKTGAYSTPLFSDVAPQLRQWKQEGKQIAIYSSGSVFAQKLLMQHVQDTARQDGKVGRACHVDHVRLLMRQSSQMTQDLSDLISAWFDTTNAGLKHDSASYAKIAQELNASIVQYGR